jgi:exosortase
MTSANTADSVALQETGEGANHRAEAPPQSRWPSVQPRWAIGGAVLAATFFWAYWPTLAELVQKWLAEPDYSHGFLVAPVAVFFLWARWDRFPHGRVRWDWAGLGLVVLSAVVRWLGARYYIEAVDGWSIMLWVAGVVWLFRGRSVLWWALPSVLFLWFMVPLPFRMERVLSLPLQDIATNLSCWTLQLLGQPAWSVGHTIHMGSQTVEVAQACSGLRIFVGIVALAFAYVAIVRRPWWERVILLVSAIPIALIANATRVVVTGLLFRYVSEEAGKEFGHDAAGWAMILLAAAMFAGVLYYVQRLFQEVESLHISEVVGREKR